MSTEEPKKWVPTIRALPDEGVVVWTKLDDSNGLRNEQKLKRYGRLWYLSDDSMCVYYTPTHWAPL